MKSVTVVVLSVLTLTGGVAGAEARGFRLRGSSFSMPHRSVPSHGATTRRIPTVAAVGAIGLFDPTPGNTSIVTRGVMSAEAQGADEAGPIPPMPPAPPALAVKKPAEPWCPSGRLAGAGTGFCLIN